jgi:hypothetical protein
MIDEDFNMMDEDFNMIYDQEKTMVGGGDEMTLTVRQS